MKGMKMALVLLLATSCFPRCRAASCRWRESQSLEILRREEPNLRGPRKKPRSKQRRKKSPLAPRAMTAHWLPPRFVTVPKLQGSFAECHLQLCLREHTPCFTLVSSREPARGWEKILASAQNESCDVLHQTSKPSQDLVVMELAILSSRVRR